MAKVTSWEGSISSISGEGPEDLMVTLEVIGERLANMRPVMKRFFEIYYEYADDSFKGEHAPIIDGGAGWAPLAERTLYERSRTGAGNKILQRLPKRNLFKAVTAGFEMATLEGVANQTYAVLTIDTGPYSQNGYNYASAMQNGSSGRAEVPARPFMPDSITMSSVLTKVGREYIEMPARVNVGELDFTAYNALYGA